MSKIGTATSYRERLDIHALNVEDIKALIKNNIINTLACWDDGKDIDKQTFHIIGAAGVGKTSMVYQIADELRAITDKVFSVIKIQSPVLSRDDLLCPFPETKTGKFKMLLSDFIPTDKDSCGIFLIDEMSRGDHNLQQLMWQIMNEQAVHTYKFPKGWFIICLDNPDDSEYYMNGIEDPAGLRRSCHLYCEVSANVFLNYAHKHNFHSLVTGFIESNPDKVYDHEAAKLGRVYANPASWERVSNILWGYDLKDDCVRISENINKIEMVVSGLLNTSMTRLFIEYVRDNSHTIRPEEILMQYKSVKTKIGTLIKAVNNPKLAALLTTFVVWMGETRPVIDGSNLDNLVEFLGDLPVDIAVMYLTRSNQFRVDGDMDAFLYIVELTTRIKKHPRGLTDIFDPLIKLSKNSNEN